MIKIKAKTKGRILSFMTALTMVMALVPTIPAFASTGSYGAFTVTGNDLSGVSYDSSLLTISAGGEYTIAQTDSGTAPADTIKVTATDDVIITLNGVNIAVDSSATGARWRLPAAPRQTRL